MNQPIDTVNEIIQKLEKTKFQCEVFKLLSDMQWHCRTCEGKQVASDQYAGGGGIQGLQRGTKTRSGLEIDRKNDYCSICKKKTTWDRWTGETRASNAAANIPKPLITKILKVYKYKDAIENRERQDHELVIDHRFPMERWGQSEANHDVNMTENEVRKKFQLLKKDMAGNHNLLKSRGCENCIKTGKRGSPLGIHFWYLGEENWGKDIPESGEDAEQGCIGCGWYDFEKWRNSLNKKLAEIQDRDLDISEDIDSK